LSFSKYLSVSKAIFSLPITMKSRHLIIFGIAVLVTLIVLLVFHFLSPKISSKPILDEKEKAVILFEREKFPYHPAVRFNTSVAWSLNAASVSGNLKLDISINPETGQITWTEKKGGLWELTITASNWIGTDRQTFLVKQLMEPYFNIEFPPVIPAGSEFTGTVSVFGAQPMTLECENVQINFSFAVPHNQEATIHWPSPEAGQYTVRFKVMNQFGEYLQTWNVTVKKEDKKEEKESEKKVEKKEVEDPMEMKTKVSSYKKIPNMHFKVKRVFKEDKMIKKQKEIVHKQEELKEKLRQKYKKVQELAIEDQKAAIKEAEQAKELAKKMNKLKEEQKKLDKEKEKREKQRLEKEEKIKEQEAEARSKEAEMQRKKEEGAKREQAEARQRYREKQQELIEAQEKARQEQHRVADKLRQDRLKKEAEEAGRIAREQQALVDEQKEARRNAEEKAREAKLSVKVPDKDTMSPEELRRKNGKGKKVQLEYDFVMTGWSFEEFYRFTKKCGVKILFFPNKITEENFEVTGLSNGKPVVSMSKWDRDNYSNKGGIVAEIPTEGKNHWNANDTFLRKAHHAEGYKMAFFFPYYFFSDLVDSAEKYYESYKRNPGIPFNKGADIVKFTITKDYRFKILSMGNTK
jgi:hypothetical protein